MLIRNMCSADGNVYQLIKRNGSETGQKSQNLGNKCTLPKLSQKLFNMYITKNAPM